MTRPTLDDLEAAADWLDEAADGWSPERRADFLAWLADQPTRLEAVRRVAQTMADPMLDAALREALATPAPVAPPIAAPADTAAPEAPAPRRWFAPALAMAACLALTVMGGGWLWMQQGQSGLHLETTAGPGLVQQLADGSTVHLDGRSNLTVHLRAGSRDLDLAAGRGLFEVAHAPQRPFTVRSNGVAVTAVGTVFEVAQIGPDTLVRVQQGRVRVTDGGTLRFLDAGHGLLLSASHKATALSFPPDPTAAASDWIDARGDRLDSVLARLAHASDRPIDCAPDLAARPISGRYRLSDPEGSLRLIAMANGWTLEPSASGWHLRPA
jgi:transmembrane sensor